MEDIVQCVVDTDTSSGSDTDSGMSDIETTDPNSHVHDKGEFFGCYLLVSKNPKFKGRTYIGFTVDPNRRIKQHNGGHQMGGARRTSGRGPWEMVLIVHGFPSDIAALRFEWAWQHPGKSRRLGKELARRKTKETPLQYRFRVVTEMLSVGPWNRLPLTIRWLKQEYEIPFPLTKQPPIHMPIAYGLVDISKPGKKTQPEPILTQPCRESGLDLEHERGLVEGSENGWIKCSVCLKVDDKEDHILHCYRDGCSMTAHMTCLALLFCRVEDQECSGQCQLVPVTGQCPQCKHDVLWGELIRKYKKGKALKNMQMELLSQPPPLKKRKTKPSATVKKKEQSHWTQSLHV